ncbi:unannotated protein [freshwater metagenome]|uniref:Unannotated protein n=1 Tax=freshwater metagenome TaxID=449393 RepID=A0A6J6X3D0_9ZZZZ
MPTGTALLMRHCWRYEMLSRPTPETIIGTALNTLK